MTTGTPSETIRGLLARGATVNMPGVYDALSARLAKLRAVLDLRDDGVDLFVVARTDARAAVSLDEGIARANDARDLGVDAVFVEAPESVDELRRVAKEVEGVVLLANMIEGWAHPAAHAHRTA